MALAVVLRSDRAPPEHVSRQATKALGSPTFSSTRSPESRFSKERCLRYKAARRYGFESPRSRPAPSVLLYSRGDDEKEAHRDTPRAR